MPKFYCFPDKMRLDSEYPEILNEYLKYCRVRNSALKSKVVDLSNHNWVYPTFLVPLCNLIFSSDLEYKSPRNFAADNYINTVLSTEYINGSTYIPLQWLPQNPMMSGDIICNNGEHYGGPNAFNFLLSELIDNIYQHSFFDTALVIAQTYPKKGFSEITIFDNGVSIPASFENNGIGSPSDPKAIWMAINGISTKDKDRGRGLNSSVDMYINGGDAEILIASRGGIFYKKKGNPAKLYNTELMNMSDNTLKKECVPQLMGTLFSVRVPYPASKIPAHLYY
jgi:hypothetical protein